MIMRPHSIRLFPKNAGATGYRITGIAARCDWVVLSDHREPRVHLHRNVDTTQPRHIFLSLRAARVAIRHFAERILPMIRTDFVLVTGSEDVTLPRQTDARWRPFDAEERAMLVQILKHPRLVHWYAENLDEGGHPKRSPLPLGLVFPDGAPGELDPPAVPPLSRRPLRVFCAHRHRDGPQWETRHHVSRMGRRPWRAFCTVPDAEMAEASFMAELARHSFVICASGGGLDPSPKAWSALLHGAIPIIRDSALSPAYARLPVVVVRDWSADAIDPQKLARWREVLRPWFDDPAGRREILYRLSADYWWRIVANGRPVASPGALASLPHRHGV